MTQIKLGKTRSLVLELDILMREYRVPHKRLDCIRGFLIFDVRNSKCMKTYFKGLNLNIGGCREGWEKNFHKIKSQLRVRLKLWELEHENWLEER